MEEEVAVTNDLDFSWHQSHVANCFDLIAIIFLIAKLLIGRLFSLLEKCQPNSSSECCSCAALDVCAVQLQKTQKT